MRKALIAACLALALLTGCERTLETVTLTLKDGTVLRIEHVEMRSWASDYHYFLQADGKETRVWWDDVRRMEIEEEAAGKEAGGSVDTNV